MRSKFAHIECFWELNRCVKLFSSHSRLVESFKMNSHQFRESVDCQVFFYTHRLLAPLTLVSTVKFFRSNVFVNTILKGDIARDSYGLAWYLNTKVHKAVKC